LDSKLEDKRFCTERQPAFPDFNLLLVALLSVVLIFSWISRIARHCTLTELSQAVIAGEQAVIAGETLPFRKCAFTRGYVVSIS
jgi:hypothetical protein